MWFGTDKGLARFNGAEFKSSAVAGSSLDSFSGEDVRSIAEDKNGIIWLATNRGVRRITKSGEDAGPLLWVREPREILVSSNGDLLVNGAEGLSHFDGRVFVPMAGSPDPTAENVKALAEDKNGGLWIASANGLSILEGQKHLSFQHWRESHGIRPQSDEPANLAEIRSLFIDTKDRVWLSTATDLYSIEDGHIARSVIAAVSSAKSAVRAISEDLRGRMWFALEGGGVVVYDSTKRESQRVNFLDRDQVGTIMTGRDGNLWFATDNGVISSDFYSFVSFTTSRGLADNDVQQIIVAPEGSGLRGRGSLWFLTLGGVSRLEGERILPVEGFRSGISVQGVAFDKAGSAWFATDQGGLKWTGDSLTQFNEGSGLASNNVQWVSAIASGSAIVFATTRGASVFREGSLRSIDALAGYDVRHVFEGDDGTLWFATGRGVVSLDQEGKAELLDTSRGLAENDVRWISRFNDKLLIATHAGIQSYNGGSAFSTIDPEPT